MALGKAVLIGAVAALDMPFVMHDETGKLGEWMRIGVVETSIGGTRVGWSWMIFLIVTLFAWGLLGWADR